jgi:two-component system nitrate/nitrite response regulator NarL
MPSSPIKVLIADDDALFLRSLRTLIDEQPELRVVAAARDGVEAIELTRDLEPDAVVVDLHMPRLDGVAALTQLRADNPSLCLIVLTSDGDEALHRTARQAGADAVLMKGEMTRALLDRLSRIRRQPAA